MLSKTTSKYIQSLQQKKFRDEHNLFVAEGPKLINELLTANDIACNAIYACPGWEPTQAQKTGEFLIIEPFELEKISGLKSPNLVLGIFSKKNEKAPVLKNKITLVLDDIRDPGNLGTILRIADWFGIDDIICSPGTADIYNPKVVQGSMGSIARVNVIYRDLSEWLSGAGEIKIFAASLHGKLLSEMDKPGEALIVIGNEAGGVSQEVLALAHEKITIPGSGRAESLNAAVAAGIILFALS